METNTTTDPSIDSRRARLDAKTLEERSRYLPTEMQELFIWLGSFCREECGGDVDILHQRFTALGFGHDKTTWSKILRGMWNRNAHGHAEKNPCLAEPKFIKAVTALRNDARIKELGGRIPFVMTSTAQSIFDFIDTRRAPDRVNKFGLIIGETGTQKSAATGEYARRNNHGAVIKVESPETPNMNQFVLDLAKAYGFPYQDTFGRRKSQVLSAVNEKRTIIVENIQRLYAAKMEDNQRIFSFLQKLQEDSGCTIIMTLTPTFERTLMAGLQKGFFEQFVGRAGGTRNFLRLPGYPTQEDVLKIAEAFGLKDAEKHLPELVKFAHEPGRIRILFEDLQNAKIEAEANGEKLTMNHILEVRG